MHKFQELTFMSFDTSHNLIQQLWKKTRKVDELRYFLPADCLFDFQLIANINFCRQELGSANEANGVTDSRGRFT